MNSMTLELSDEINDRINEIARKSGLSKAETMRRAFSLLSVAAEQMEQGRSLAVVDKNLHPVARLVDIL